MDKPDLKPCPFCGSKNLYWGHESFCRFQVSCLDCKCSGPIISVPEFFPDEYNLTDNAEGTMERLDKECLKKAIDGWNNREAS